ncbi:MAG: bactofilin family protein [Myxococcota bacterium]
MTSTFHIHRGEVARGRLSGAGAVVVEGRLEGEVHVLGPVRVARGGEVVGPVRAPRAEVEGTVRGPVIAAQEVRIAAGGLVVGDVRAPRVLVDDAGRIDGAVRFDLEEGAAPPEGEGPGGDVRLEGEVGRSDVGEDASRMPRLGRLRARWRGGPLVAALAVLVGCGCAARPLTLKPEPRAFTADDYADVYEAWTRDAKKFAMSELSDVLHVTATFESWEFRWAYVVRYARDYGLSPETRDEMLRATLADAREHHRFFVTLSGRRYRESDLTGARSAWRVLLVDDQGRQTVPSEIEKVRRPDPATRVYFPSISSFRQAFRISFPARREDGSASIPAGAERVFLRLTGPRGRVDLEWELTRHESP